MVGVCIRLEIIASLKFDDAVSAALRKIAISFCSVQRPGKRKILPVETGEFQEVEP
jgi:hypothetical protein